MKSQAKFGSWRIAKVADLIPYARNARTHTPEQIARIAASIQEFGFTNPILCDGKRGVIAGHGRLLAAQELGMETVPTVELRHLTEEQRRAYVLTDNRSALDAGWDASILAAEFEALADAGFDLALTGFSPVEIDTFTGAPAEPPDAAAEWEGMPDFEQGEAGAFRTINVHFTDAEAVARFFALIGQPIPGREKFIWYPAVERARTARDGYRYVNAASVSDLHPEQEPVG